MNYSHIFSQGGQKKPYEVPFMEIVNGETPQIICTSDPDNGVFPGGTIKPLF